MDICAWGRGTVGQEREESCKAESQKCPCAPRNTIPLRDGWRVPKPRLPSPSRVLSRTRRVRALEGSAIAQSLPRQQREVVIEAQEEEWSDEHKRESGSRKVAHTERVGGKTS